ncbi:unnamed protein product [Sphenostylis stenocarpa]|uniref:Uncharacterized protein n=1 Tax=Sphenostylis stenocarpa TaxID=92480 RepID=A0AA86VD06_9FABA|nr:unnamed protein product [Sphenostylis stenocarpa]
MDTDKPANFRTRGDLQLWLKLTVVPICFKQKSNLQNSFVSVPNVLMNMGMQINIMEAPKSS